MTAPTASEAVAALQEKAQYLRTACRCEDSTNPCQHDLATHAAAKARLAALEHAEFAALVAALEAAEPITSHFALEITATRVRDVLSRILSEAQETLRG